MIKKLLLQFRIFFLMLWSYDGTRHWIGIKDAFWYATHLDWWGLE